MNRATVRTILGLAFSAMCAYAQPKTGAPAKVAGGSYECWAHGRPRLLLNFKILSDSKYSDTDDKPGTYSFDPKSGRIAFKGGALDGVLPDGFYTVYHEPHGKPTVSFRNRSAEEVSFCEKN